MDFLELELLPKLNDLYAIIFEMSEIKIIRKNDELKVKEAVKRLREGFGTGEVVIRTLNPRFSYRH